MKNLRTLGAACVLALLLAVPASAGHIEIGYVPPPPPPPPDAVTTAIELDAGSIAGHIECPVTSTDPVIEAALSLLQSVLALF